MSRWFRFYDSALDDPKVQRLPADLFRAWVNLLCLACRGGGRLPDLPDVAFALRVSDAEAEAIVGRLAAAGLLDATDDGWEPHNWRGRQFASDNDDGATERKRRQREREALARAPKQAPEPDRASDVPSENQPMSRTEKEELSQTTNPLPSQDVTRDTSRPMSRNVTRIEQNRTDSESETDSETQTLSGSRRKARSPDRVSVTYPDEFLILWESFPRHPNGSKHEACKAWLRLPPGDRDACLDGAMAYGRFLAVERAKRPDYPALHLATFVNQRRWESLLESELAGRCVN